MTIADPVFVFKMPSYQLFNWHHPKHHLIVNVVLLTKTERCTWYLLGRVVRFFFSPHQNLITFDKWVSNALDLILCFFFYSVCKSIV